MVDKDCSVRFVMQLKLSAMIRVRNFSFKYTVNSHLLIIKVLEVFQLYMVNKIFLTFILGNLHIHLPFVQTAFMKQFLCFVHTVII